MHISQRLSEIWKKKKEEENKSKYVWSLELSLVFCGLIGTRDEAAGIGEEFLGVEAETYGAETRFEIVGEEKYTKSNEGKGCQCVKNIMCNHGSYRKVKHYLTSAYRNESLKGTRN